MSKHIHDDIHQVSDKINVWDTDSTCIQYTVCFRPRTFFFFLDKGLGNKESASFLSDLHTKLIRDNRGVPGFATGSYWAFGAVNETLASCVMVKFRVLVSQ